MEFKIFDGRTEFFQWDLKQKLILEGFNNVEQVHFDDGCHETAYVAETYNADGRTLVDVPSDALTIGGSIKVYAYDIDTTNGDRTLYVQRFIVNRRSKPADYVYEERDVRHLEDLIRMTEDFINNSVNDELNEARANLENHEDEKERELDDYVTNVKKPELDDYEKEKEAQLNSHTESKKSEINSHTESKKSELDSYVNDVKKPELDAYEAEKENEIQAKVDSFTDYSDTQKRLANIENMKLAYFDDEGFINIKE